MTIEQTRTGAEAVAAPAAALTVEVFPQSSIVPANILRWHLVFDRPVAVDRWLENVRLVDDSGNIVENAFLDLPDGLWDAEGRILTIMMHPGRIKEGIGADKDGVTLDVGQNYRLIIDLNGFTLDASPGAGRHIHPFTATAEERSAINRSDWVILNPRPGSSDLMTVAFGRVMDLLSVQSSLAVHAASGDAIAADISLMMGSRTAVITPRDRWPEGSISIVANHMLEDVAGQRMGDRFEREISIP